MITIERLTEYNEADAIGIGKLLPQLSPRLNDTPISESALKEIIESPDYVQIVARDIGDSDNTDPAAGSSAAGDRIAAAGSSAAVDNNNRVAASSTRESVTGKIIGTATLSKILGLTERYAYLEKLIVDQNYRGQKVADRIWQEMLDWCKENHLEFIEMTSKASRKAAHSFYFRQGAQPRETTPIRFLIQN